MSGSIKLHPEFGLNPTMIQCFWCGEDTGEIALLGFAYKGEAPRSAVLNHDPCESCEAVFSKGIFLFEVEGDVPTGRHWVISRDAEVFNYVKPKELRDQILAKGGASLDPETAKAIGLYSIKDTI